MIKCTNDWLGSESFNIDKSTWSESEGIDRIVGNQKGERFSLAFAFWFIKTYPKYSSQSIFEIENRKSMVPSFVLPSNILVGSGITSQETNDLKRVRNSKKNVRRQVERDDVEIAKNEGVLARLAGFMDDTTTEEKQFNGMTHNQKECDKRVPFPVIGCEEYKIFAQPPRKIMQDKLISKPSKVVMRGDELHFDPGNAVSDVFRDLA